MSTRSSSNGTSARTCARTLSALSQRWQPCAWYKVTRRLRVEATRGRRLGDAPDGDRVGALPHRERTFLVHSPRLGERARDDVVQLGVHLRFLPEVLLQPLYPLEVRDDDAAGVREDVREHEDSAVLQNAVRLRRHRPVGALADDSGPDLVGVVTGDHLLEGARREDVALQEEKLVVRDLVAAVEPLERPGFALVRGRGGDVQPVRIVDA